MTAMTPLPHKSRYNKCVRNTGPSGRGWAHTLDYRNPNFDIGAGFCAAGAVLFVLKDFLVIEELLHHASCIE